MISNWLARRGLAPDHVLWHTPAAIIRFGDLEVNPQAVPRILRHPSLRTRAAIVLAAGVVATVATWAMASVQTQVAVLGVGLALLSSWLVSTRESAPHHTRDSNGTSKVHGQVSVVSVDAEHASILEIVDRMRELAQISDPLLRQYTLSKLAAAAEEFRAIACGRLIFTNTETWRAAYEKVLSDSGVTEYRSVSWVKNEDYWQDLPGLQSMQFNYDLIARGVRIERILILGWNLWPAGAELPLPGVQKWIDEQHYRGIWTSLLHESDLINEPELLRDFGIYGHRATGEQELDEQSRTMQFVLSFDFPSMRLARDRWDRLLLFAVPYNKLLDQSGPDR